MDLCIEFRQVEARGIAVQGFLMILKHFKVLGGITSSQSSQSFSISASQVGIIFCEFYHCGNSRSSLRFL